MTISWCFVVLVHAYACMVEWKFTLWSCLVIETKLDVT